MNFYKPLLILFISSIFAFFSNESTAQDNAAFEKLYNQARDFYRSGNHKQAIIAGKKANAIDDTHYNTHLILAYSYEEIDSVNAEIFHLKKALEITDIPEANYWLGEAYHKLGSYSEALYYYNRYKDYPFISDKRKLIMACKMADATFKIQSLKEIISFDSEVSNSDQYWPVSSTDGKELLFEPVGKESKIPFENSFVSAMEEESADNSKNLDTKVNVENQNSSMSEPEIVFFSACNRPDGLGDCDIYFSRIVDGIWSEAENAGPALNTEFAELQPTFSSKNKVLYFSSNRPGGKGENDIWSAKLTRFSEEGVPVWGSIENRREMNSDGNEISPFFDSKSQNLYFASNARIGLGGFDLYQSLAAASGSVQKIKNLGYPINTDADELGLLVTYMYDTAYFTSARDKGNGLEIFAFNLTRGLHTDPSNYMLIKLINKKTRQAISADIELVNLTPGSTEVRMEKLNEKGEKIIRIHPNRNYQINIAENGYMFYSKQILQQTTNTLEDPVVLDIELDPIEMGAEIDLYNINYQTNSFAIIPASEPELKRLVDFLAKNKTVKVEIQGHTDSTGDPASNLELSELRAKSVADYLVRNKISISRLVHKGYGDKMPVATNDTEEGRSLNRRTTIKITGL